MYEKVCIRFHMIGNEPQYDDTLTFPPNSAICQPELPFLAVCGFSLVHHFHNYFHEAMLDLSRCIQHVTLGQPCCHGRLSWEINLWPCLDVKSFMIDQRMNPQPSAKNDVYNWGFPAWPHTYLIQVNPVGFKFSTLAASVPIQLHRMMVFPLSLFSMCLVKKVPMPPKFPEPPKAA